MDKRIQLGELIIDITWHDDLPEGIDGYMKPLVCKVGVAKTAPFETLWHEILEALNVAVLGGRLTHDQIEILSDNQVECLKQLGYVV